MQIANKLCNILAYKPEFYYSGFLLDKFRNLFIIIKLLLKPYNIIFLRLSNTTFLIVL